jgi:hypothetical protein
MELNSMPMTSHDFTIKLMVFTTLGPSPAGDAEKRRRISFIDFYDASMVRASELRVNENTSHLYCNLHHIPFLRYDRTAAAASDFRFYEAFTASRNEGEKENFESSEMSFKIENLGTIKLNKHQM